MRHMFFRKAWIALLLLAMKAAMVWHTPAYANWRNEVGIFRIGIVKEESASTFEIRMEPFRLALTEALQIEVEFYQAPDAVAIIDAFKSERIEYAILPSSAYALAWLACECVEPIAVPKASDSTDGFHTVIITRADGPADLNSLLSKKIAILQQKSLTGHRFPLYLLEKEGLTFGDEGVEFMLPETSEEALAAMQQGDVDALIGWSSMTGEAVSGYSRGTMRTLVERAGASGSQYRVLWQSPQIPHHPHVVRRKLDGEAKRILRDALVNLYDDDPVAYDAIEPVYGGGFTATRQDRFQALIDFVDTIYQATETDSSGPAPSPEADTNKTDDPSESGG